MVFCCNLGTKEVRILMLGLDNAGKTSKNIRFYRVNFYSMLYTLCTLLLFALSYYLHSSHSSATLYMLKPQKPPVTTVPTVGFNVECHMQGNIKLNIWVCENSKGCF